MGKLFTNQSGIVRIAPLLVIIAVVGVISFLLISSTAPFGSSLFGNMYPKSHSQAATSFLFGTLVTDPNKAATEAQSGVGVAMMEMSWADIEPQDGVFDTTKLNQFKQRLTQYQAAGQKVVLGFALHYTPAWAFNYPNSRFVDQYGVSSAGVNLTFNQTLRTKAEAYMDQINQYLGLNNFYAIRITTGEGELLFPDTTDSAGNVGTYWAFDSNAQNGLGKPTSIPNNPFPGWKIGQTTYNGQSFSTSQVKQWLDWYIGALDDTANWQIQYFKAKGYTGQFQLLTPGRGTRPDLYNQEIDNYLNINWDSTTGRGSVWHKVYQLLPDKQNAVVYISSMADNSGTPANDLCASTDLNYGVGDTDYNASVENNWSATRWQVRIAKQYNMFANGENPDNYPNSNYNLTMMQNTAAQMSSCGMQGMFWAHDFHLYDGTDSLSLPAYNSIITQYNGSGPTPSPSPTSTPTSTPKPSPTISPSPTPAGDTTPPTVSITLPTNGSTIQKGGSVTITAQASDNIGVQRVEFYIAGSLKCTDTTSPYSCGWNNIPNASNKQYPLSAKSFDTSGNQSTLFSVTVTAR